MTRIDRLARRIKDLQDIVLKCWPPDYLSKPFSLHLTRVDSDAMQVDPDAGGVIRN
jgi:hypothetical protein